MLDRRHPLHHYHLSGRSNQLHRSATTSTHSIYASLYIY